MGIPVNDRIMIKFKLILFVVGFLILEACQRNVYFNDFEKSLLEIYEEGDTLIFESDKGVLDTTYIVLKDVGYATWNPFAHERKYKVLSGTIYYGSNRIREDNKGIGKIISIGKKHPETTWVSISHKDVSIARYYNKFSIESWNGYKVGERLYRFKYKGGAMLRDSVIEIETELFFDLKQGVVKYITNDGELWTRINIRK